nr:MAG TPA: hypothetical protein [Caudoviricetes sp.]
MHPPFSCRNCHTYTLPYARIICHQNGIKIILTLLVFCKVRGLTYLAPPSPKAWKSPYKGEN